jgi:predicted N-acetyltransferase YhbS
MISRALNWPYRREDWAFALDLGHGLVAEHKGQVLGTALWWLYGDDVASVGMVIVSPQARRQRIGARLMDALLARLEGRRIVLNATPDGLPLYERLGFLPCGAVHQHQAVLTAAPRIDSDATIRPLGPDDLAALRALDRAGSGMDRDGLIAALRAIGQIKVLERDGEVQAYGCARVWGRGVVIGPVVAETREDAQSIIAALAVDHEGRFLRIDVTRRSELSPAGGHRPAAGRCGGGHGQGTAHRPVRPPGGLRAFQPVAGLALLLSIGSSMIETATKPAATLETGSRAIVAHWPRMRGW